MNIRELYDERMTLVRECRGMMEAAGDSGLGAEDAEVYDRKWARVEELNGIIERAQRLADAEAAIAAGGMGERPGPAGDDDGEGGGVDFAVRQGEVHREIRGFLLDPQAPPRVELRALSAGEDEYGGYLYQPIEFVDRLIKNVDNAVFMRQYGTGMTVVGAGGIGFPTLEADPADPIWTNEVNIGDEDSTMEVGNREMRPHPLAKFIKVSRTLLRRAPSAEALVNDRLSYKFAVTWENNALNGTGSNQPLGIFTTVDGAGISASRDMSEANTASEIKGDNLIAVKYALKAQYWPNSRWLFHRDAVKQIAQLKDGESRYLWQVSLREGQPDTILGRPLLVSEYCPNTFETGLLVGCFGDFSFYWYVDELSFDLIRLIELYAGSNQVGFVGRWESDGMAVVEEAFLRIKLG